jgi:hypothetical protein
VDAAATIFRRAPVTDAIVKRTAVTIINQCHVRWYHEKFLPFTYSTHSPNITKLMKTSQYVPYNTHSPHITKLMKTSQYVSYNTHSPPITKISENFSTCSSMVKPSKISFYTNVIYYNSLMLQSTHFHM